jgi:serine/threonine protein kinase
MSQCNREGLVQLEIQPQLNPDSLKFTKVESLYEITQDEFTRGTHTKVFDGVNSQTGCSVKLKMPFSTDCSDLWGDTTFDTECIRRFFLEAWIMGNLRSENGDSHPSIVSLHDFIIIEYEGKSVPVIVMENVPGFVLGRWREEHLRALMLENKLDLIKSFGSGVDFVHSRGFVIGDISDRSLVINPETAKGKLIDFGEAKRIGERAYSHSYGFTPPTVLSGRDWTPFDEVWAYTAVVYKILSNGRLPYGDNGSASALDDAVCYPENLQEILPSDFEQADQLTPSKLEELNNLFHRVLNLRDPSIRTCEDVSSLIEQILQS